MSGSGGGKPGLGVSVDDGVGYSSFWDTNTNSEFRLVTQSDIDKIDWNNVSADDILNALPAGTSFQVAMHVLIKQIIRLTNKVQALEDEITDRIILEPKKP